MKTRPFPTALLLCLTLGIPATGVERPGTIRGIVVDDRGVPVPAVQVSADLSDGLPKLAPMRTTETDKRGHFSLGNLEFGNYKVFAMKESAGYPDTSFAFYSNQMFATAALTANAPIADLTLTVGPAAGVVTGLVMNQEHTPISATFLLRRAADPDNWISMSQRPEYRVLLPPGADILLEVSAPGYKTLYYGGPSDSLRRPPIRLEFGKEMKLNIQLDSEDKAETRP